MQIRFLSLILVVSLNLLAQNQSNVSQKPKLKFDWLAAPSERIKGVVIKNAVLVDDGKYIMVEGIIARSNMKMKAGETVNLPAIKAETPRTFFVRIPHTAKVEKLEFVFEDTATAEKHEIALQIGDDAFFEKVAEPVVAAAPPPTPMLPIPTTANAQVPYCIMPNAQVKTVVDADMAQRQVVLTAPSTFNIDFGYGTSLIKGTDVQTQKTATLASEGDMYVSIGWQTTHLQKIRTRYSYSFTTIKRIAPVGWLVTSNATMLDRPSVASEFVIWKNLSFHPGVSFGEFEWVKISNGEITLKKTRLISLDYAFKFLPFTMSSFMYGFIVQGQSLAFSEGGHRLDLGAEVQGTGNWKKLSFSFLTGNSSLLMETSKNSQSESSFVLKYTF